MRRIAIGERPDWRAIAEAQGFTFHHEAGQRYWDERAAYAFTMEEIERELEAPTEELHAMCLHLVDDAAGSDALMERLAIPPDMRDFVAASWAEGAPSLYGRFDFAYDGTGPAKLLEYNADTPTSIYETGFFQWAWLEARIADGTLPASADQFNSLHEKLIARFAALFTRGSLLHFTSVADHVEDRQTVRYLEDLASQAGLEPKFTDINRIGVDADGRFVDEDRFIIAALFKLYPWEDMFREPYAGHLAGSRTIFLEPAWKSVLSNKAMLPLLWQRHRGHPNLLPAYFEDDPAKSELDASYVRKPFFSREGWDIELVDEGRRSDPMVGGYGAEGHILQALARLPSWDGNYPAIGSWIVGDEAAGVSIREDETQITRNLSRFVPHLIGDTLVG
ncbi:MAG: glutathionylspermidine synthase family protein [Pseudomonadota bacterium]|nr:glutathionylspermidine synthase family protein [Pseudomonadota bacterium]